MKQFRLTTLRQMNETNYQEGKERKKKTRGGEEKKRHANEQ